VAQAALGRSRRVAALQLLIAVSRLCPGWLPGLSWILRAFGGPLLALWSYGLTAKLLFPSHWRSIQFWKRVLPIYCAYKKTQLAVVGKSEDARSKAWAKRHEWGARKVYDLCVGLRGFYLKDGQVSTGATCCFHFALRGHAPSLHTKDGVIYWARLSLSLTDVKRDDCWQNMFCLTTIAPV
jgi:hypothetical protein